MVTLARAVREAPALLDVGVAGMLGRVSRSAAAVAAAQAETGGAAG